MSMKIVLLLVGLALAGFVFRKTEVRYRKRKKREQEQNDIRTWKIETMRRLKALKGYDENGYVRETKDELVSLYQRIDEAVEKVVGLTNKEGEKDMTELIQEGEAMQERMKQTHRTLDTLLAELENHLAYVTDFIDKTHFYPPQFALDNNKLSGMIVEIKDRRNKNPFLVTEHYQTFGRTLREQVEAFHAKHGEVASLIEEIEQTWDDFSDQKKQEVLEKKQDLFLSLHKGELEQVEEQKIALSSYLQRA